MNGTFIYTGLTDLEGSITYNLSVFSTGNPFTWNWKWVVSTDDGATFVDLADPVTLAAYIGTIRTNVGDVLPFRASPGDQFKLQIERPQLDQNMIVHDATMLITGT